jgi:hypothetical protein
MSSISSSPSLTFWAICLIAWIISWRSHRRWRVVEIVRVPGGPHLGVIDRLIVAAWQQVLLASTVTLIWMAVDALVVAQSIEVLLEQPHQLWTSSEPASGSRVENAYTVAPRIPSSMHQSRSSSSLSLPLTWPRWW